MTSFIPREKLSKRAKRDLDRSKRHLWERSPITRKVDSKKNYNRKKAGQCADLHDDRFFDCTAAC